MLWGLPPTLSFETEHAAVLPLKATAAHPETVLEPSLNWTVPSLFGLPALDVTVAVKASESLYTLGLEPPVRTRLVDVCLRAKKSLPVTVWPAATEMFESGFAPVFAYPVGTL